MKKAAKKKPLIPREPTPRLLAFDPTPAGLITIPLRKAFRDLWKRIRKERFAGGDFHCEECGDLRDGARWLDGHEVYAFPDQEVVQLSHIEFVCRLCHDAIHFERLRRRAQEPYLAEVAAHYCKVNGGIPADDFRQDIIDTFNRMLSIRTVYGGPGAKPSMDYGPLQSRVDELLRKRRESLRKRNEQDDEDWEALMEDYGFEMLPDHEYAESVIARWR